ncbi:MAG: vWA domain-containing protein [Pirellulaceae bacterium]
MIDSQWFSLSPTAFTIPFSILIVIVCGALCWMAMQRSGFRRLTVWLETIRFLLVGMVAVALNQPEWLQRFAPVDEPVVAVLWDNSGSMDTEDISSTGDSGTAESISRLKSLESLTQSETWQNFSERFEVEVVPFSSGLTDPRRGSDINSALASALERHSNLRAVVLASDGSWNYGQPPTDSATQYRMQNIPIFSVGVGSEMAQPDIELVSLDAPTFGVVNKPTRIPFSITSTMARDVSVNVTLSATDGDELSGMFVVPANGTLQEAFVWNPTRVGDYSLTIDVPPSDGEKILANNSITTPISIRKEALKVLVVESFPRWEYRFLRNALARDPGVDVACLLFHPDLEAKGGGKDYIQEFPASNDELAKFDVIFLGDVGIGEDQLTNDDCRRIRGLVESQATGLILMPGFRGYQHSLMQSELNDLFPVVFDPSQPRGWGNLVPAQFQLTEAGSESLLTKLADSPAANVSVWRSLPGFQWYAAVQRAKVGSLVLAVHATETNSNGRIPLLVTKTFGAGKILFMGTDGAWRWRKGVEDKYHYRFWGQVARWMAYQRNMAGGESMRLFYSPDRPKTGQTLSLNANVMDLSGEPLQSGTVNVQITSPSGNTQLVRLASQIDQEQWGLFSGYFVPEESGEHLAVVSCLETGASVEARISVQGQERERIGKPADFDVLKEISTISRGKLVGIGDVNSLIDEIRNIPEPEPQIKRIRLWAHPAWGATFLVLATIFWVGRKLAGVI